MLFPHNTKMNINFSNNESDEKFVATRSLDLTPLHFCLLDYLKNVDSTLLEKENCQCLSWNTAKYYNECDISTSSKVIEQYIYEQLVLWFQFKVFFIIPRHNRFYVHTRAMIMDCPFCAWRVKRYFYVTFFKRLI